MGSLKKLETHSLPLLKKFDTLLPIKANLDPKNGLFHNRGEIHGTPAVFVVVFFRQFRWPKTNVWVAPTASFVNAPGAEANVDGLLGGVGSKLL